MENKDVQPTLHKHPQNCPKKGFYIGYDAGL